MDEAGTGLIVPEFDSKINDILKFCMEIQIFKSCALLPLSPIILKLVFINSPNKLKKIFHQSLCPVLALFQHHGNIQLLSLSEILAGIPV